MGVNAAGFESSEQHCRITRTLTIVEVVTQGTHTCTRTQIEAIYRSCALQQKAAKHAPRVLYLAPPYFM